jgi:hypothetical protein
MSAGDIDNVEYSDERWADFRGNNLRLLMLLGMPFRFNTQYDIPFLGGISTDAHTIYLDRHYLRMWSGVDTGQFIAVHETTEWYCMVHLGMPYIKGHRWANTAEDHAVFMAGLDPKLYNKFVDQFVPKTEHEKIKITPKDLFMGPYAEDKPLYTHIRSVAQ